MCDCDLVILFSRRRRRLWGQVEARQGPASVLQRLLAVPVLGRSEVGLVLVPSCRGGWPKRASDDTRHTAAAACTY